MTELTPLQKKLLDFFSKSFLKDEFYWTGGTLLSFLYLRHRLSNDIDFFSDKPVNYEQVSKFIQELKKEIKLPNVKEKKIHDRREFILHNKEKLRLEFVHYDHPKIKPRKKWKGLSVDSLDDMAANKLMFLFDRNDPKDLFDLYFLLTKKGYTIKKLLNLVEKKFGVKIAEGTILSETYKSVKDIDNLKPLILAKNQREKQRLIEEIKEYFSNLSDKYLRKTMN